MWRRIIALLILFYLSIVEALRVGSFGSWVNRRAVVRPGLARAVPEEIANMQSVNDMVLVERVSSMEKSFRGILLPAAEGRDRKHLGVVLSIPKGIVVSDKGSSQPVEALCPYKVGDTVFIKVRI